LLIAAIAAVIMWWDELTQAFLKSGDGMDILVASIGSLMGPIGWLIAAAALIFKHWGPIRGFFAGLWTGVLNIFDSAIDRIMSVVDKVKGAASLISKHWGPIKGFFAGLWTGVVNIFDSAIDKIMGVVDKVKGAALAIVGIISSIGSGVGDFFGFGDDVATSGGGRTGPQVVSPQDRVARSIEEQRTTSTAEVTIRDESGRAEVTGGSMGPGLSLQPSGAF
jgi:phage-related protein